MSGGQQRYWNEATQRWEDTAAGAAAATPPPPPRPVSAPGTPPGVDPGRPEDVSAPVPPPAHGGWSVPEEPAPGVDPGRPEGVPAPVPPPPHDGWSVPEEPQTGSWPPPVPPQAPRGPSRRLVWSVLGGAAVAGAAVALVLTLVLPGDDGTDDRGAPAGASPTASDPTASDPTAPPSASDTSTLRTGEPGTPTDVSGSPSGTATALPGGYEPYTDPEGFTVARPAGWVRDAVPSQYGIDVVNYRSSDGELRLQVYQVEEASPEASFELFLSDDTPKADGFRKLSLQNLDDGDFTGSRLEYVADSIKGEPDVGTWHVVDERFVAADGEVYAIAAYGADADGRDDERELLRTALGHFCPPDTTCGTGADAL
ncbi:hypothetical protein ACWDF1_13305 [Streptomyces coelicoflavus]|uniref:hypothetical protein n=1 Tax=Streptomyces coelicoflavus TaxID=285562 RepID=UPI0036902305